MAFPITVDEFTEIDFKGDPSTRVKIKGGNVKTEFTVGVFDKQYTMWEISVNKGTTPVALTGKYTNVTDAIDAVKRYITTKKPSSVVKYEQTHDSKSS